MVELVARSMTDPSRQWQKHLPAGRVVLGKHPKLCQLVVEWDNQVSRVHAWLEWKEGRLRVERIRTMKPPFPFPEAELPFKARNPIYYRDEDQEFEPFAVLPGEWFVIGETRFTVLEPPEDATPASEMTCSRGDLLDVRYLDPDERLAVLADLPDVIRFVTRNEEMERHVARVLLRGIPRAQAAAVVRLAPDAASPSVLAAEYRSAAQPALQPSKRLVHKAIGSGRNEVFRWDGLSTSSGFPTEAMDEFEWAFCVPLPEEPTPGWGLYVAGRLAAPSAGTEGTVMADQLKPDVKFAELVADVFASLRHVRDLRQRYDELARFLSRGVITELAGCEADQIPATLEARPVLATVMFCDLRGFSKMVEAENQPLQELWRRVREALAVMTSNITDRDGVIGDFQGDAAMGFWGWPAGGGDEASRLKRQAEHAARAALATWRDFYKRKKEEGDPLKDFSCGIGLATGPAYAGRLGTPDQFKVGAFGHVVNLASRLESQTKEFGAAILMDEATAEVLAALPDRKWFRLRRVARVIPAGMKEPLTVTELLPPAGEPGVLSEPHRQRYEKALDAFLAGDWGAAERHLDQCNPDDGPVKYLSRYMKANPKPADWRGAIAPPK